MLNRLSVPLIVIIFFFVSMFVYVKLAGPIPFSVNSVTTSKSDTYNVTGEGKVSITPDIAVVTLGVSSTASTVKQAQDSMNLAINKVSDAVKALGVKSEDIQTTNYNISPNYDYTQPAQKITGYSANTNLTVKVRDLGKASQIVDAGTANGANQVGGISFDVADKTKAENEARQKAVTDAKNKASQAAKIAGFSLGRLINYQENSGNQLMPQPMLAVRGGEASADSKTSVQTGSTDIVIDVTLSYEIR